MRNWIYTSDRLPDDTREENCYQVSYLWGPDNDTPLVHRNAFTWDAERGEFVNIEGDNLEDDFLTPVESGGIAYAWREWGQPDPAPWPKEN